MRENALSHKPSPQHPGPELQETLKTEQETAIIRFAFGEGYSGQECQEGPRGEESETCLEAGIDSHKREVVQATRKGKGPQASPAAQKVQGFSLWGGNPQHHQGLTQMVSNARRLWSKARPTFPGCLTLYSGLHVYL